ncbi:MAG TPA: hypothetical protein PL157_18010, partial [Acidobacteriota bacterium]|nr:hypothetical protein [Acidobacteriota bacterium]
PISSTQLLQPDFFSPKPNVFRPRSSTLFLEAFAFPDWRFLVKRRILPGSVHPQSLRSEK